jgi:peptidoglycan/LPS O-acetylase OafA/YrhL
MLHYLLDPPVWSLGVELVCYAASPIFARLRTWQLMVLVFLSAITQLRVQGIAYHHLTVPVNVFFFLLGFIAYRFCDQHALLSRAARLGLAAAAFVLLLLPVTEAFLFSTTAFVFTATERFGFWALFAACLPGLFLTTKNARWDRELGLLSYPLYLSHWYFAGLGSPILVLGTSISVAIILVWLIDKPIEAIRRQRAGRRSRPAESLPGGLRHSGVREQARSIGVAPYAGFPNIAHKIFLFRPSIERIIRARARRAGPIVPIPPSRNRGFAAKGR